MDPWRDCERIYDLHFMDRMSTKFLPKQDVKEALKDGKKTEESKNEYAVKWKSWTLRVTRQTCFIYLRTAFHT